MKLDDYMSNNENLPEFMKDFHDQKDLFKVIYDQYREGNTKKLLEDVNWVDAHCFTIDVFLWWMGRHGYKLQKTRKKGVNFNDVHDTIKHFTDIRKGRSIEALKNALK